MTTRTTDTARPAIARSGGVLFVLLAAQFLANIDSAIANIAAPSIRTELHATAGEVTFVVSGYVVAFAVLLITGARLGSTIGYRRVFLIGLAIFVSASLVCGLAPGIAPLIVARFVQGAGAALMVPQVLSGIHMHFIGQRRVRAIGAYAIALSGGAVAGQILGGMLVTANLFGTGWRPIFLINVPLGAVLFVAAVRVLPRDPEWTADAGHAAREGTDLGGVVSLSAAVLLLTVPLVFGGSAGWPAWSVIAISASVPAFAWFVVVERRVAAHGGRPLVSSTLLRASAVRFGLIAHGLTTATYFAILFVLAQYLQLGLGLSAEYSGFAMVSWVAAFGVAGVVVPRLPRRLARFVPMVGCLVLAAAYASICLYLMIGGRSGGILFALLALGGFGLGISGTSLISVITSAAHERFASEVSGIINTNAQLTGALGVAAAASAYAGIWAGGAADAGTSDAGSAFATVLAGLTAVALVAAFAARRSTARSSTSRAE